VYKVVLDVLGHHLKETDGPNFKVIFDISIVVFIGLQEEVLTLGYKVQ
jgi:hypothetical protein